MKSEAWVVVDPTNGKMRLFTNEDNASRQAFHFLYKLTYSATPPGIGGSGRRGMTCEDVTWL